MNLSKLPALLTELRMRTWVTGETLACRSSKKRRAPGTSESEGLTHEYTISCGATPTPQDNALVSVSVYAGIGKQVVTDNQLTCVK